MMDIQELPKKRTVDDSNRIIFLKANLYFFFVLLEYDKTTELRLQLETSEMVTHHCQIDYLRTQLIE